MAVFLVAMTAMTVYIFAAKIWWFPPAITAFGHEIDDQFMRTLIITGIVFVLAQLGLAYAVGGGFELPYDHPGEFRVEVLTKSATTVEATSNALEEIAGTNSRPFTEEELKRAKDDILNSFLFRYDTKGKVLAESERLEFYGYPADYLETYRAALEKVTLDDVTAAAKKYVHPGKLAVLVVGNGPEIKQSQSLDALGLGAPKPIDITIPRPAPPKGAGGAGEQ